MPTLTQIRDAIQGVLAGVPGIGPVHKFERYLKREAELQALYVSGGQLKGWLIRRLSTREQALAVGRTVVTHRWQIRGYRAIDDATQSELAFDDTIEAIRDAFRADETLGGLVKGLEESAGQGGDVAGVQLADSGPVLFAGVLCHAARLSLTTWHEQ